MGSEKVETVMVNEGGEPQSKIEVHDLGFVKLLDVMGHEWMPSMRSSESAV